MYDAVYRCNKTGESLVDCLPVKYLMKRDFIMFGLSKKERIEKNKNRAEELNKQLTEENLGFLQRRRMQRELRTVLTALKDAGVKEVEFNFQLVVRF